VAVKTTKRALLLAVAGAAAVAGGVAWIYQPAGLIVAGLELLAGAYVSRYLEARR
jgi:inosine/xanthosine triphosphate pyrophosphatase family protein